MTPLPEPRGSRLLPLLLRMRMRPFEPLLNRAPALACASLLGLCLLAGASRAAAQNPGPPAPAATPPAVSTPAPSPVPPAWWGRWRAERRAARQAQQADAAGTAAAGDNGAHGVNPFQGQGGPALQRFLERLPPAERESFQRNLKRWRELTPQEREALRGQAGQQRAQLLQESERALQESGLILSNDSREMFLLRFSQERRKLERELREKTEAERARRLPLINEALKQEFSASQSANGGDNRRSSIPAASPSAR
jgi:hypothetical protein